MSFGHGGLVSRFSRLKNHFEVDGHGMIASGDHILLMHIAGHENMEQAEPCPGTAEEALKAPPVGTVRVIDEFAPAVTLSGEDARRSEVERGGAGVQPFNNVAPKSVQPEILWLVQDLTSISEADQMDRTPEIV